MREAGLDAFDHQDVPFERLVEALAPARSLAAHPLFQVMVTCRTTPPRCWTCPGWPPRRLPAGAEAAKFDLSVALAEVIGPDGTPGGLRGTLTAAADLFDPGTAGLIARRLERVLAAVAAAPDARLRDIEVLTPAERGTAGRGLE